MRARGLDFMLQEFVGGDDQICSFHSYFDRYSEPLAWRSWSSGETSPMAFTASTRYLDATGQPLPAERLRGQAGWAWVNTDFEVGFLWKNLTQGFPVTLPWRILSRRTAHSKFA